MLRESLDVVIVHRPSVDERLDIGEQRFLFVFHVATNLLCILVVELHDESSQRITLADAFLQLTTDEGQLEVEIKGMAGLQIVQQRGYADVLVILIIGEVVDGEVDHSQKRVCVDIVHVARLAYGLVTKAKVNTE